MSHPYLLLSESTTYAGKLLVGESETSGDDGCGLTNKSIKIVEIPSFFNEKEIVQIGYYALVGGIFTSIFIPKTIVEICRGALEMCYSLKEVRFEKGSKLQKLGILVFWRCTALRKIDFPPLITSIGEFSKNLFFGDIPLECFSYEGTHDFSSLSNFFYSVTNVYVPNNYPTSTFAGKSITGRGKTCGVSKEHLEKK